jgi:hypothetical protein
LLRRRKKRLRAQLRHGTTAKSLLDDATRVENAPTGIIVVIVLVLRVTDGIVMIAPPIGRGDLATGRQKERNGQRGSDHRGSRARQNPGGTEVIGIDMIIVVET